MDNNCSRCAQLRAKFIQDEMDNLPSYIWKHEEGDRYLPPKVLDNIMKQANENFKHCPHIQKSSCR